MIRLLAGLLLALGAVPASAQPGEDASHARTVLAESSANACILRLDVSEALGTREIAIRGNSLVMAAVRATLRDPRPGPRNADPAACRATGLPTAPQEVTVMLPAARIAAPPAPGEAIEVVADAVPGFAPYGVGGVLLAYVRRVPAQ